MSPNHHAHQLDDSMELAAGPVGRRSHLPSPSPPSLGHPSKIIVLLMLALAAGPLGLGLPQAGLVRAFPEPKSLKEQTYVEDVIAKSSVAPPSGLLSRAKPPVFEPGAILEALKAEHARNIERLQSYKTEDSKKALADLNGLIGQYIELANISNTKCDLELASDLVYVIHFHQGHASEPLMNFLKHYVHEQFQLCRPKWDANFMGAVNGSLSGPVQSWMRALLDNLLSIKFKRDKRMLGRPYAHQALRQVIADQPPAALLIFMTRWGLLDDVDPMTMNEPGYSRVKFEQAYEKSVLTLCRRVCSVLKPAAAIYLYALDESLPQKLDKAGQDLMEWLASEMICCKVVRSHDKPGAKGRDYIMDNAFIELTTQPETFEVPEGVADELKALKLFDCLKK